MERQSIGSLIKILSETMGQRVNRDCRGYNLTMQQMKILHFLKGREGRQETSQKDIQDHMRIAHSTVVSILRLMESKGFIKISVSERDKRMKIVTLTGSGGELCAGSHTGRQGHGETAGPGLQRGGAEDSPGLSAANV